MATQYAGGGRRSTAPEYTPRAILGMSALPGQQSVVPQMLQSFTQPASTMPPVGLLNQSSAQAIGTLSNVSSIASSIGKLTDTPSLSSIGKQAGQALSLVGFADRLSRAKRPEDVALAAASNPLVMSSIGIPGSFAGPIAGAVTGFERGGLEGAVAGGVESYMHMTNPITALVDGILALTGNDSILEFASDVAQPVVDVAGDALSGIGGAAEDIVSGVGGAVSDVGSAIGDIFGW